MEKEDLEKATNSLLHSLMTQIVAKLKIKGTKLTGYTPEYGTYTVIINREDGYNITYILHRANCSLCLSGIVDEMIAGEKPIIHPLYWLSEDVLYKDNKELEVGSKDFDELLFNIISLIATNYALVVNNTIAKYYPLQKFSVVAYNGSLLASSKDGIVFAGYEYNDKVLMDVTDITVASDSNLKEKSVGVAYLNGEDNSDKDEVFTA